MKRPDTEIGRAIETGQLVERSFLHRKVARGVQSRTPLKGVEMPNALGRGQSAFWLPEESRK